MPTRKCEFCGKELGSGASYRTHKSTYHRPSKQEEPQTDMTVDPKPAESTSGQTSDPRQSYRGDDNLGEVLAVGGVIVGAILLFLFGGKK